MKKNVLFLVTFIAIALMSCDNTKYSDFYKSEYQRWNLYYQTMTKDDVTLMALFDDDKQNQIIPYSREFVNITCPADFNYQLFLCEKANGEKYLYNRNGNSMLQAPFDDENGNTVEGVPWVPVPYLSHEWKNNKLLFTPFHPGVRLDVKTPRGTLVIYDLSIKYEYGYCSNYVPGQNGYMMFAGNGWWFCRARFIEPQYHSNSIETYETVFKDEVIFNGMDELYEINAITEQEVYLLTRQGNQWKVYNLDGQEVKKYPYWINKNLPNKARKTYDMTNRTTPILNAPYPRFYGNKTAGLIIHRCMDKYEYRY